MKCYRTQSKTKALLAQSKFLTKQVIESLAAYCRCGLCALVLITINVECVEAEQDNNYLSCFGCNVVLLNIELLRPEFVGLIGNGLLTPSIDRFFSTSIIFHDVTAPAGETFLSNTAVLTATPTHKIDIRPIKMDRFEELDEAEQQQIRRRLTKLESIASILSDTGYRTININQGGRAGKAVFLDRGFSEFSQWSSKLLFEDMVELLIRRLQTIGGQKFFLLFRTTFLHNHQYRRPVHSDIAAPVHSRKIDYTYLDGFGRKRSGVLLKRPKHVSEEVKRQVERAIYTGQVRYGDEVLKKMFDSIDGNLLNKTIFVLYANHGTGLGDNNIYKHGTAYQSAVSVPLLIRMPGLEETVHVRKPVALIDLVPSLLKMLNVDQGKRRTAFTFDQVIFGKTSEDRVIYGRNGFDEFVRYKNWKYIVEYGRFSSLYDLETDPRETKNLANENVVMSRELEALLLRYKTRLLRENEE